MFAIASQGPELRQYFKYEKPLQQMNYRQIAPDSGFITVFVFDCYIDSNPVSR